MYAEVKELNVGKDGGGYKIKTKQQECFRQQYECCVSRGNKGTANDRMHAAVAMIRIVCCVFQLLVVSFAED